MCVGCLDPSLLAFVPTPSQLCPGERVGIFTLTFSYCLLLFARLSVIRYSQRVRVPPWHPPSILCALTIHILTLTVSSDAVYSSSYAFSAVLAEKGIAVDLNSEDDDAGPKVLESDGEVRFFFFFFFFFFVASCVCYRQYLITAQSPSQKLFQTQTMPCVGRALCVRSNSCG